MSARLRKILVFSSLPVAVIIAVVSFFPAEKDSQFKIAESDMPKTIPGIPAPKANLIDIEKYAELDWGRDPFTFKNNTEVTIPDSPRPEWKLGGILFDKNSPSAIVNKKIVSQGDIIDGATVIEINESNVILEANGNRYQLTLTRKES